MDVSKLLEKARESAERRNYDYAIELYMQALKLSPDESVARRELRAVENRMAKERGTSMMAKVKVTALSTKAQGLLAVKKYDSAIEACEDALKLDPGSISVMLMLGKACMSAGYKQSAVVTFEDIRTLNAGGNQKQMIEATHELALAYEAVGKISEALDMWQLKNKLVPSGDRDAIVKIRDLSARTMTTKIEAAASSGVRGGAAISTQTAEQAKERMKLDREKGDIKSADDLKAAIDDTLAELKQRADDPRISLVYMKLGDLYKQAANYPESKKAYESAVQKDPVNYTYKFKLHDLEMWKMLTALKTLEPKVKAGDAAARDQFAKDRQALLEYQLMSFLEREKQYSTDSKIKFELGKIYHELARNNKAYYDEAIRRFQVTFGDPKFRIDSGLRMGQCFGAKSQFELALKRFSETLAGMQLKNQQWKDLMYEKADTLVKAGQKDEAKKIFLEVYEIDVSFRDISKRLDELG